MVLAAVPGCESGHVHLCYQYVPERECVSLTLLDRTDQRDHAIVITMLLRLLAIVVCNVRRAVCVRLLVPREVRQCSGCCRRGDHPAYVREILLRSRSCVAVFVSDPHHRSACWPFVGLVFVTLGLNAVIRMSFGKVLRWSVLSLACFLVRLPPCSPLIELSGAACDADPLDGTAAMHRSRLLVLQQTRRTAAQHCAVQLDDAARRRRSVVRRGAVVVLLAEPRVELQRGAASGHRVGAGTEAPRHDGA